jgi:myo-inositol-1(or 4)-monophosphatase
VDGTYNFVSGLPAWCSALALLDGEHLVLGAIYQATTGELWVGGRDLPTTLNGVPLPRLADRPLADVAISVYLHPGRVGDLPLRDGLLRAVAGAASVRIIGSGSVELAAIAAGRLGVWLHADTLSWDWLPGAALVTAAGGVIDVFHHGGHRWHVAGPPTGVAEARAAVLGTS